MSPAATMESLRKRVRGPIITADDEGYDQARAVYNAMHDRHPRVIVQALDEADVMASVNFAREAGLELAVRGGGHSAPGYGTCDDGVVLDLRAIRNVRVDPQARTARVGGGAKLGELDHATHAYGLAVPAGFVSTTGVGGLTLGGGIGYLNRRFGLTCDSLLSADVITAQGRRVTASRDENADLFWALRGGGGNFGVVTSFDFELQPVKDIVGGPIVFELDAAADVLRTWRDYLREAPRELGAFFGFHRAPPLPFIPEERQGDNVCLLVTCWSGDPDEAQAVLEPLQTAGPVIGQHVGPMPYPALQGAFDALLPPGCYSYWKSDFALDVADDAVPAHLEHGALVPNVQSAAHIYPLGGAVRDVGPEETAFGSRDAEFAINIVGFWTDPADTETFRSWVRGYYDAVHPFAGFEGGYTNFMDVEDQARVRENYGGTYDRLARVKAEWDPDNLFHLNQNIAPAR
ncbi:MAG: FAD-binding oxidoreductase [Candidatus Palauibacterales bacterium]|nr:FAD-binding oxidoreductase [Candidatus Palauibacterales bacterium]MDP2531077.1 FAD-binding oxidoreductase [Candidatus Palauibacterales bacterium]MDP2582743.1 FAD-binding oxidoreductase [Candidatus Palauibacterales bacterium]